MTKYHTKWGLNIFFNKKEKEKKGYNSNLKPMLAL